MTMTEQMLNTWPRRGIDKNAVTRCIDVFVDLLISLG